MSGYSDEQVAALRQRAELAEQWVTGLQSGMFMALDAFAAERERAGREEACRVVCRNCRVGMPVTITANGSGPILPYHIFPGGAMDGTDLWDRCDAAALRDRAQEGEGRAGITSANLLTFVSVRSGPRPSGTRCGRSMR